MSMQQILSALRSFDGVLELAPQEGSDYPPVAWGDHFFYWSPDGTVPRTQPFATLVTKDYPDDTSSNLDPEGRWRLNIHVGRRRLDRLGLGEPDDPTAADVLRPHPLYARQGWLCVTLPGERSRPAVMPLLELARDDQRRRLNGALDTARGNRKDPMG